MTEDEARKVIEAIFDGSGFADADVGRAIIEELKVQFPELKWDVLGMEEDKKELEEKERDRDPQLGQCWRHYKGHEYVIVGLGRLEADNTPAVIYRRIAAGDETYWIRSRLNFLDVIGTSWNHGSGLTNYRFWRKS